MNFLQITGLLSFLFVLVFTFRAYTKTEGAGQSPRSSIIETWMNILIGFTINFTANYFILPIVHAHFSPMENFEMGWIYTAISIVRQYTIRRWFNGMLHKAAITLAGGKNA